VLADGVVEDDEKDFLDKLQNAVELSDNEAVTIVRVMVIRIRAEADSVQPPATACSASRERERPEDYSVAHAPARPWSAGSLQRLELEIRNSMRKNSACMPR
jgi:hypothetical protein